MDFNFIPDNVSKHDNVYDVLKERGFIEQCTDEDKVRELLQKEKIKFYIGFDPTADCLHVGHFMQVIIMMYMQKFGHTPVVLIGGGTGMVGDPSGRTDMRQVMSIETIEHNCEQFKKLFDRSPYRSPRKCRMEFLFRLLFCISFRLNPLHRSRP